MLDRLCCGSYYNALCNICPHRTGPPCRGRLPLLVLPDGLTITREGEINRCPWREQEMGFKAGETLYDRHLCEHTCRAKAVGGTAGVERVTWVDIFLSGTVHKVSPTC